MTENIVNNDSQKKAGPDTALLPDFCNIRNVFITVLLTEVLALAFSLAASSTYEQFWNYLALSSLLMIWIALLNSVALCALRGYLNRINQTACLILAFCLMMCVSLLVSLIVSQLGQVYFNVFESATSGSLYTVRIFAISGIVYMILLRYFYVQHQWRVNLAAQSEAEIQALRARIRPHFLFNSMNTIASLIDISPDIAEKAVEDLSDLFRASLDEKNMSRLGDEIELTKSYLSIEVLRLGDRLQTEWDIDQNLLDTEVPALSLQPLVENAIYHGIEPLQNGGKIKISALKIDNRLSISVSNPLSTDNIASTRKKGNQMAQNNIKQRLKLVYGNQGKFTINDTKENYTVSLLIPLDVTHERIDR